MLDASQRSVKKNSLTWWYVLKTSWRYLCKTSWICLEDVFETSWRRLEDILKTFFKTFFWRSKAKASIFVLIKTSWRRFHQDECLLGIYDASSGLITLSTLLLELVSLFLKNYKIDFDLSELKWIVASLMFIRFFVRTFFLKSLNFRLVDTLSAQFHSHMDYLIYWRHANSTHLPYSSFARNFEFSSLVIRILLSTKSQNFTILLFSNFT